MSDPHTKTQPVILIGVDRQEAPEFTELCVVVETPEGESLSEETFLGGVSVEMINNKLIVYVRKDA